MSHAVIAQPSGPAAGFGLLMSPQTIEQVQSFCKMLAATDFVPKAFRGKPDSIMVVGAMGARLGVDVFSAMAGIADINGKPSVYGDLMLAVCMNNQHFEDCVEVYEGKPYEDTFRAICTAKRKGREPVVRSFSVIEAKEASLWKKAGPWTSTPQRMLQMRARSFALRDTFADALAGFHSVEEMEGQMVDVTSSATVRDEPKEGKSRKASADKDGSRAVVGALLVADRDATSTSDIQREPMDTEKAPETAPEATKLVTIPGVKARVAELWKTADGKQLVKDHMATWKLAKVEDLGELAPEEPGRFLAKLDEIVATHIQLKGALK